MTDLNISQEAKTQTLLIAVIREMGRISAQQSGMYQTTVSSLMMKDEAAATSF